MQAALITSAVTLLMVFIMVVYLHNDQFEYVADIFRNLMPKCFYSKSPKRKHRQMFYSTTMGCRTKIINSSEDEKHIIYLDRNRNKNDFSPISMEFGMHYKHERIDTHLPINPKPCDTESNISSREHTPQRVIDDMPPPPIREIPSAQWEESSSCQSRSPSPRRNTDVDYNGPTRIYDMPI